MDDYQRGYDEGYQAGLDDHTDELSEKVEQAEAGVFEELHKGWYDDVVFARVLLWANAPAGSLQARAWAAIARAATLTGVEREHALAEARECLGA